MRIFVDTSALIALLNPRDQNHEAVTSWLRSQKGSVQRITSNLVLAELLTFFSRHGTLPTVLEFQREILTKPDVTVIWIDQPLHEEASRILEKFKDQRLSFTDAASLAIMRKNHLSLALAFDEDFQKAGFQTLP